MTNFTDIIKKIIIDAAKANAKKTVSQQPKSAQLKSLSPQEFAAGQARQQAFERTPLEILKQSPIAKGPKIYNPETQGTAPVTRQVIVPGLSLPMDFPASIIGGFRQVVSPGVIGTTTAPLKPFKGETKLTSSIEQPNILQRFIQGAISTTPTLGGEEQVFEDKDLDETVRFIAPVIFSPGLSLGKQAFGELSAITKNAILFKNKLVSGNEIKIGLQELTSGIKSGATSEGLQAAQELINLNSKGSELFKSISQGATIKVKRDFVNWIKTTLSFKADKSIAAQKLLNQLDSVDASTAPNFLIENFYQKGLEIFKPQRLVNLQGLGNILKRPGIEKAAPLPDTKVKEVEAIREFMSQFKNPLKAAQSGQIEPSKYLPVRDEAFAQLVNLGKVPSMGKTALGTPNLDYLKKYYGVTDMMPIESAIDAIQTGKKLGYKPEDIAHYLVRNYVPGGIEFLEGGGKAPNLTEFYGQGGSVSPELKPLYEEAKKYKSAEEFVGSLHNRDFGGKSELDQMKTVLARNFIEEQRIHLKEKPDVLKKAADELGVIYSKELNSFVKPPKSFSDYFSGKEKLQPVTESQLIDIWNQANQKLPDTTLKTDRSIGIGREKKLTPEELAIRPWGGGTNIDNNIITAVERAVGKKQAQEFKVKFKSNKMFQGIQDAGISNEEDFTRLFNFFDNPSKYPLPKTLENKLGNETIKRIKDLKSLLTQEQVGRELLATVIDDESYMRTFLIQLDGNPPTPSQMNSLLERTPSGLTKKLFGISKSEGVSGLSLKNRYNQSRKFGNADERDTYLATFGLKTDRNFVDVMRKTINQVTKITSNYDFIKSLREQAKKAIQGVREIYDPVTFKNFREQQYQKLKVVRDQILQGARNQKLINQQEYKAALNRTSDLIDSLKASIKDWTDTPTDLRKLYLNQVAVDMNVAKESLFKDMKFKALKISELAKKEISNVKIQTESLIEDEINRISKIYAEALEAGYKRPKDIVIAQQLTGLMFDKPSLSALDKIFTKLHPSNIEDIIRGLKLFMLTGDLFQLPEVARQRFGTGGVRGLLKNWGFEEDTFYSKGIDAVEHGLLLGKPADITVDITRKLGRELEDIEKSFIAKEFEKLQKGIAKVPLVKQVAEISGKAFESLEKLQWETVVPNAKLAIYDKLWPQMLKNYKKLNIEEAKKLTAEFVNDTFQGLNWERLMAGNTVLGKLINQSTVRALRFVFFGPDRLTSLFNRYTKGFGKYGKEYRKFWIRSAITGGIILEGMNWAFNGHSTLENVRGGEFELQIPQIKDEKGNPLHLNILGTWAEPLKFANKPKDYLTNKIGVLGKILGFGQESYQRPATFLDFIWEFKPIPFSLQQLLEPLKQSEKEKTGETTFPISALRAGLEFAGFPTTFRSGKSKAATIEDLITGKATFYQYLLSKDIKSESKLKSNGGLFGKKSKKKRLFK